MAKYQAILDEVQAKQSALFNECGVFWAFSKEQFLESAPDKSVALVSLGMGGYMPKVHHAKLVKGLAEIKAYGKAEIKKAKAEEVILYELKNYECLYTGDITDAMEVLGCQYTEAEVLAVYRKHYKLEEAF